MEVGSQAPISILLCRNVNQIGMKMATVISNLWIFREIAQAAFLLAFRTRL
jgi:hypothetical protein